MSLDLDLVRRQFPALSNGAVLMDNAGGSVPPRQVIDRAASYMRECAVQLGADYPLSVEAVRRVREGHEAAARFLDAAPGEVVIGPSTTMNAFVLASAFRESLEPGDEVVVTNLDHEANIGAWRRLERHGIAIREWRFRSETCRLEIDDLRPLLSDRTRLVCFTHCSNLVGAYHDVPEIARVIHDAGALACVDGVAYAPHRRARPAALGADFYFVSLYKTFGPHLAALWGRRDLLQRLPSQNHFFVGEDEVPYKFQPGNVNHELTASLAGVTEYLELVALSAVGPGPEPGCAGGAPGAAGSAVEARGSSATGPRAVSRAGSADPVDRAFAAFEEHEERLAARLLDYLASRPDVTIFGPGAADRAARAPIVSFVVGDRDSADVVAEIDRSGVAVRYGHFYAHRAIEQLGLHGRNGVVRVSLLHYNTLDEVDRLIAALDPIA